MTRLTLLLWPPKRLPKLMPVAVACWVLCGGAVGQTSQANQTPAAPFQEFQRPAPVAPVPRTAPGLSPPAAQPDRPPVESIRFVLRGVQLRGSTRLSAEAVSAVAQPYLRREVDFAALQEIAAALGALYRAEGWVARVSLPAQDLTEGVVTFEVTEARFGGAEIELSEDTRLSLDRASAYVTSALPRGEAVNTRSLDRAILLLDDLPGVAASGELAAGSAAGQTALQLRLSTEPLLSGQVSFDNAGSNATGAWRASGSLALNSPLGIGDQATLAAVRSEGTTLARTGWSFPVGTDGLRLGVNAAALDYQVTASSFAALAAKGRFNSWGLDASYPLVRSLRRNLSLQVGLEDKRLFNQAAGAVVSDYQVTNTTLGVSGSALDEWLGGGSWGGSLVYTAGNLNLSNSPNRAADATGARTAGAFGKWRYALSRQQSLGPRTSLLVAWSGQVASKNLDSSERFFLGGSAGVRAYPFGEGGGSEGQLVNLELRQNLGQGFTLAGFYDWGRVTVNRNNNFTGAATLNQYELSGVGASLTWANASGTTLSATWARRLGNNPAANANANGNDQDGTRNLNRLWLLATHRF